MKEKTPFYFGWIVVAVSFVTLALTFGVWYSFAVFFVALLKEFGWSRSTAAGAFSIFVIFHGLTGPFVGGLVDRFGPKRVFLLGSAFLGVGLALTSFVETWWQLYVFFGILAGVGTGFLGWVPNATIIQQWFKAKRGLAMGIISSGIGIGMLCVPSFQLLITHVGWRMAYRIIAMTIPLIIVSMAIVFLERSPQTNSSNDLEVGISYSGNKDPLVVNKEWASQSWKIRRAITTKAFWLLALCYLLNNLTIQTILTHQAAFFVDHGLDVLFASYIGGIIGIVSVGSKILWGVISDKIRREIAYTIGVSFCICGVIILVIFNMFHYSSLPYLYALFFGIGYAAIVCLTPLIIADFFEGQGYGQIFGTLVMINTVGGAFGPWLAGFLHDHVGSYVPIFMITIACALSSSFFIWLAGPSKIRIVPGKMKRSRI